MFVCLQALNEMRWAFVRVFIRTEIVQGTGQASSVDTIVMGYSAPSEEYRKMRLEFSSHQPVSLLGGGQGETENIEHIYCDSQFEQPKQMVTEEYSAGKRM